MNLAPGDHITSRMPHNNTCVQGIVTWLSSSGETFLWKDRLDNKKLAVTYPDTIASEGVEWVRGWEGDEVDAFKAGIAL